MTQLLSQVKSLLPQAKLIWGALYQSIYICDQFNLILRELSLCQYMSIDLAKRLEISILNIQCYSFICLWKFYFSVHSDIPLMWWEDLFFESLNKSYGCMPSMILDFELLCTLNALTYVSSDWAFSDWDLKKLKWNFLIIYLVNLGEGAKIITPCMRFILLFMMYMYTYIGK